MNNQTPNEVSFINSITDINSKTSVQKNAIITQQIDTVLNAHPHYKFKGFNGKGEVTPRGSLIYELVFINPKTV